MKANAIHNMSTEELNTKLVELKEQLLFLRLKHATGQQENPMVMVACKKDIARILTVLRERDIADSKKA